jgi:hypothetical protein
MSIAIQKGSELAFTDSALVTGGQTVRLGMPIILASGTATEATAKGTLSVAICVGCENQSTFPGTAAAAGTRINFVRYGSPCVVKALVGAAGATAGADAIADTNGLVDYTLSNGANAVCCAGVWVETGVSGDLRGLYLGGAYHAVGA